MGRGSSFRKAFDNVGLVRSLLPGCAFDHGDCNVSNGNTDQG